MDQKNPFEGLDNIAPEPTPPPAGEPGRVHMPLAGEPTPPPPPSAPPTAPANAWKPAATAPVKKSGSKVWIAVVGFVVIGVLGGAYFAYSQGYVSLPFSIPFVTTPSERFMMKLASSGTQLKQAQYVFKMDVVTEPRDPKQPAVSLKNTNDQSDAFGVLDAYGVGLGDANSDINATGQMTFYYEYDQPIKTSNASITLSGGTNGQTDQVVVDVRKVGSDLYGRLTKAPDVAGGFIELDGFVGKWIHLGSAEVTDELFNQQGLKDINPQAQVEEVRRLTNIANQNKVIRSVKRLGKQNIGGASTEHISFGIDSTKLEPFLQAVIKDMKDRGKQTGAFEESLKSLQKDRSSVQQFFDAATFELWIEPKTGMMRQFVTTMLSEHANNKQIRLTVRMTLDKLNEKITVEKPIIAMELDALFQSVFAPTTPSVSADINSQSVMVQYALASCYVNKHPTVLDAKPKNELNDSWKDYVSASAKDIGCDKYTSEQIESAGPLLTTDADADGLDLMTERFFGSKDDKKDTDGDSFDDYTEVNKGYNPNGSGALLESMPSL